MYTEHYIDNALKSVVYTVDDVTKRHIPINESNADYQRYQLWLADGNVPQVVHSIIFSSSDEPTPEERLAALELVVSMVFGEGDANV